MLAGQGKVYPEGPWRPEYSVQRGSIQFISVCAGDPAREYAPHGRSVKEVCELQSVSQGIDQFRIVPSLRPPGVERALGLARVHNILGVTLYGMYCIHRDCIRILSYQKCLCLYVYRK